jgi:hypothetical protein
MDCQEWIPVQYFKMAFYICLAIYTLVAYSVFSSTLQKTPKDKKASILIHEKEEASVYRSNSTVWNKVM